jgi:hypothetical protein
VDFSAVSGIVRRNLRAIALLIPARPWAISGDARPGNSISRAQSGGCIAVTGFFRRKNCFWAPQSCACSPEASIPQQ